MKNNNNNNNNKSENKRIYLDNGATTKVDAEVLDAMIPFFSKEYGNPSSLHEEGRSAEEQIDMAKEIILDSISGDENMDKIVFTGSATEANNMAICSFAYANKSKGNHIITTKIEHNAILNPCKKLEEEGFEVTYLDVNSDGKINLDNLKDAINKKTILISIIHANHEIGTIQDLENIGKICLEKNIVFHSDCAQSFSKVEIDVQKYNLGMASLNAHKLHGPKGIGALYVRRGVLLKSLILGGPQEYAIRAGTENVPLIAGFRKTVEMAMREMNKNTNQMRELRDYMIARFLSEISHTKLNGSSGSDRLCNNVNITFDFVEGEAMLLHLDLLGIAISTGSACSSKSLKPSNILTAIGNSATQCHGSLRFTLSKYTTKDEIDFCVDKVKQVVSNLRELSPLKEVEN